MDETVAVVDNKNKVIGHKLRSQLTDLDCWRTACIWVEDGKGNVLLQQRAANLKVSPLKWTCAAAGTVVGSDSYKDTAIRELKEEIGIDATDLQVGNIVFCRSSFGWRYSQGYVIVCDYPIEKFTIQEEEVAQVKWFDKNTVLREIGGGDTKYATTASSYRQLFNLS